MLELVLASRNKHKAEEFEDMLSDLGVRVVPVTEFAEVPEVVEDGDTFEANAVKKAAEVARFLGRPTLADDSGLEVDAIGGNPGVRSARYAGENATDAQNNEKLLDALRGVPAEQRTARFQCVIALAVPTTDGVSVDTARGTCEGKIGFAAAGGGGFGYDPLFIVPENGKTFAELGAAEKNQISHRARAMQNARQMIRGWKTTAEKRK